jgi:predicted N-formylglutamate amidohydrolase
MNRIVTCEHGGNTVPARFRQLFTGRKRMLKSHRGYDEHALQFARLLAHEHEARLFSSSITRLLVDLNRSPHHRKLFSEVSGQMGREEKKYVLKNYYLPYRRTVESSVTNSASKGKTTLHISVHSFAPVMNGLKKNADIGLLYDPSRRREKALCIHWQKHIQEAVPVLRVRRNYPYLGKADGLVTHLRKKFPPDLYIGIELELNQKIMKTHKILRNLLCRNLVSGLRSEI